MSGEPVIAGEALLRRDRTIKAVQPLFVVAWGGFALGVVLRLFARQGLPFWLDETWTGAIVAQDSLAESLRQSLLDANAPLYFALMHGWLQLFGLSNEAMRVPTLMFGALAPLLALIPLKGIPRSVGYLWCALLALWFPGIPYSQEARCYMLLFFLVTACLIAYVRLIEQPSTRRAALWALLGALSILTHYHALILVGLQGLAYLAVHRARALATWPAALIFLPALGWAAYHLPHVAQFSDPRFAWFDRLGFGDLPGIAAFALGGMDVAVGVVALTSLAWFARAKTEAGTEPFPSSLGIALGINALGAAILLAGGMLSTTFTARYLIPFVPGLMLGVALAAVRLGRRAPVIPLALALLFAGTAVTRAVTGRSADLKAYNFEAASDALMAAGVRRMVFLWDNPLGQIWDRGQLAAIGGFFFRRAGVPVEVEAIAVTPGEDPNARLLAQAKRPGAILWIYDLEVRGTAAQTFPPRIGAPWDCREFGRGKVGVLACYTKSE